MKPAVHKILSVIGDGITVNDCITKTGYKRGVVEVTLYEMWMCGMVERERIGAAYYYTIKDKGARHAHKKDRINGRTSAARERLDEIVAMLTARQMSKMEVAAALGISESSAYQYLRRLKLDKRIYISAWECNRWPRYKAGSRPDINKKPRQTSKEVCARYRRKRKNDPEYHIKNMMRLRLARIKSKRVQDPFLAQFAGLFKKVA